MTASDWDAERVLALYEAARVNGSLITVEEIIPLLPNELSEADLSEAIASVPLLNSKLRVHSGYVIGKDGGCESERDTQLEEKNRIRAHSNLKLAERFAPLVDRGSLLLIAVSGSTSYGSASNSVDLDFFLVTSPGGLWTQLAKSLLLARAFRLLNRGSPEICFSCVMDFDYATRKFQERRTALFARDALQAVVLKGENTYRSLLARARWMSGFYPALYANRIGKWNDMNPLTGTYARTSVVDRLLSIVVGLYIRTKGRMKNRALAKLGRESDIFELLIGGDHLVYESRRYKSTNAAYSGRMKTMLLAGSADPKNGVGHGRSLAR